MERIETRRLERAVKDLNEEYNADGIGFFMPSNEEDYGIDILTSGVTKSGNEVWLKTELKTISNLYGDLFDKGGFYRTRAARNRAWRYGLTADTKTSQEAINSDRTGAPWWAGTDRPLHVLNAADKYGNTDDAKLTKLLENRYPVVVMFKGGYLVFTAEDLEKAIVGYAWQLLPHNKELADKSVRWELKAVIDMSMYTRWIKKDIPADLL